MFLTLFCTNSPNPSLCHSWEYDLSSWDQAAGALLVREAGGKFTNLAGEEWQVRDRKVCATNGKVHDAILASLREANVVE